jgi:hypothetical protein
LYGPKISIRIIYDGMTPQQYATSLFAKLLVLEAIDRPYDMISNVVLDKGVLSSNVIFRAPRIMNYLAGSS